MMPVSPHAGAPQLEWDVAVERVNAAQCTYWITVKNLTSKQVTFEMRYAILS
jgi:glycyl-tRNA synthetase alpha subunit